MSYRAAACGRYTCRAASGRTVGHRFSKQLLNGGGVVIAAKEVALDQLGAARGGLAEAAAARRANVDPVSFSEDHILVFGEVHRDRMLVTLQDLDSVRKAGRTAKHTGGAHPAMIHHE